MRPKISFLSFPGIVLELLIFANDGKLNPQWKGTIENVRPFQSV